ncbi:PhnD/SsuA/transferrin family substrate-binding protein [Leptolyngbya sp. 'hensonii']|nr:PhnD/SsuA/transferrin family substrate-binding protein [Leptolyngbya sp. 'hensonii']
MIAPLDAYLEKALGQPVEFLIATSYKDVVGMMLKGKVDRAYSNCGFN